jgi:hypothetical protein
MSYWTENPLIKPKTDQTLYGGEISIFFGKYIGEGEGNLNDLNDLLNRWASNSIIKNKSEYLNRKITEQKDYFLKNTTGKQAEYNTRAQTLKDLVGRLSLSGGRRRSHRRTRRSRSSRKSLRVNKKTRRR